LRRTRSAAAIIAAAMLSAGPGHDLGTDPSGIADGYRDNGWGDRHLDLFFRPWPPAPASRAFRTV
ncbi:MAG TPA: hypothetical protein VI007_10860, partial [bacterium]